MIRIYNKLAPLFFLACMASPLLAKAESCRHITNTISKDLIRYSGNIQNKHLPWMNFVWLQQQLGTADAKSISATHTQYRWNCETDESFLVALVDKNGSLIKLRGQ